MLLEIVVNVCEPEIVSVINILSSAVRVGDVVLN